MVSYDDNDNEEDDEYTNLCLSASCSFYSYTPHFPSSISFSFFPYLTMLLLYINFSDDDAEEESYAKWVLPAGSLLYNKDGDSGIVPNHYNYDDSDTHMSHISAGGLTWEVTAPTEVPGECLTPSLFIASCDSLWTH